MKRLLCLLAVVALAAAWTVRPVADEAVKRKRRGTAMFLCGRAQNRTAIYICSRRYLVLAAPASHLADSHAVFKQIVTTVQFPN